MEHSKTHACCADKKANAPEIVSAHEGHIGHGKTSWNAAAHATLHCLTGCVIGELAGLMVGVSLGLHPYSSMALTTVLAYISGFSLTVFPLMKRTKFGFRTALKVIWLGEAVSIGIMELVMNSVDYHMGGIRAGSVFNPLFWEALAMAVPAGYLAALPVNFWLIGKELKKGCH